MVDAQPTWKDRVEKYRKLEEQWKRKPQGQIGTIVEIVKETSIPALEAGLSAIIPLAKANTMEEYTRDVLAVLFKNVASTKPTTKKTVKEIMEAQAHHNPSYVVLAASTHIKDKNPKIITETLKILVEHAALLDKYLMGPILPHAAFLFGHGTGSVREEATRLFQILAEKDPEEVGEAVKTLRPIQVKEIFQPPQEKKQMAAVQQAAAPVQQIQRQERNAQSMPQTPSDISASAKPSSSSESSARMSAMPIVEKKPVSRKGKESGALPAKPKEYKVVSLIDNFYERFRSAQWKERLVMEELDEKLGSNKKLDRNDTHDVLDAIIKKIGESNNKVFIAAMSVASKIASREKIQESFAIQITKAVGKRLKDKKEQVQQSVTNLIVTLVEIYKAPILLELSAMAVSDKTVRHGVLKTFDACIDLVSEKEIESAKAFKSLVECTKDQNADIRALACTCISKVLSKKEELVTQGEIEAYGVERLLAAKIEAQTEDLFKKKDAEITAIIESLCEDIRNTSIKTEPITPIRTAQSTAQSQENMTVSPIITQSLKRDKMNIPIQDINGDNVFIDPPYQASQIQQPSVCSTNSMNRSPSEPEIMNFIKTGEIDGSVLRSLIDVLGSSPIVSTRALSLLSVININEETAMQIKEKMEMLSVTEPHSVLMAESLKSKVLRIINEKSAFEEKCLFASLCDSLMKGERVPQEALVSAISMAEKRSTVLKEEQAFLIIKTSAEMEYWDVLSMLDKVFPILKILTVLISLAETHPAFINSIYFLLQRAPMIPNTWMEGVVGSQKFISLLERAETPASAQILTLLKKENIITTYSPCAKKVRRSEEIADINLLLNDIIDQNSVHSHASLEKLEQVSVQNLSALLRSASTVVNVLLLQLSDSLSSGGTYANVYIIIGIIKRICESDVFLSTLDAGTLLSLVSDYIVIITGQIPRGSASPEGIKKECSESLLKMCVNAPFLTMFKIYINLLSNRYREEKVREILVKLLWKHSKLSSSAISDRSVVMGIVNRLNAFYTEFRGDLRSDQLITKVLQLHLIEILKQYGEEFLKVFKVTGPVLQQVHALGGVKL
ncbi:hypothetical protein NEIRO03_0721 [Nematocida sp. AWRm78]|nr:hypothetical protein NEIRO02_0927 [Nematocida sp. AWRm79]KAI5183097.1 hypothetical protein NEIRO03_0721 [Nematocida sp. AWRm78]